MTSSPVQLQPAVEWSVAARALPGETTSGDLHVVVPFSGGTLMGVVDGLGHGEEAMEAARLAGAVIEQHATQSVATIVNRCHQMLQRTRGVVMTLASLDAHAGALTVLGIGNVETMIFHAGAEGARRCESVLLRGGVVGYRLPALQESIIPVAPGDLIVFATDGIREDFAALVGEQETPVQLVEKILAQKFRGTDDGLVLACKLAGRS